VPIVELDSWLAIVAILPQSYHVTNLSALFTDFFHLLTLQINDGHVPPFLIAQIPSLDLLPLFYAMLCAIFLKSLFDGVNVLQRMLSLLLNNGIIAKRDVQIDAQVLFVIVRGYFVLLRQMRT
jgi:hypothetical protein